jgi:hypothetical protein
VARFANFHSFFAIPPDVQDLELLAGVCGPEELANRVQYLSIP